MAYLSEEKLDYTNISYGKVHTRILFLFNHSNTESLSFEFINFKIFKDDVFTISPLSGELGPKEKVVIKFHLEQVG